MECIVKKYIVINKETCEAIIFFRERDGLIKLPTVTNGKTITSDFDYDLASLFSNITNDFEDSNRLVRYQSNILNKNGRRTARSEYLDYYALFIDLNKENASMINTVCNQYGYNAVALPIKELRGILEREKDNLVSLLEFDSEMVTAVQTLDLKMQ